MIHSRRSNIRMAHVLVALILIIGMGGAPIAEAANHVRIVRTNTSGVESIYAAGETIRNAVEERANEVRNIAEELKEEHLPDEIIVRFAKDAEFQRVRLAGGSHVSDVLQAYRNRDDVLYAEPNYIAHAFSVNDQYYSLQWNLHTGLGGIDAERAWNLSTGQGVVVAVLDTGVAYEDYNAGRSRYYEAPDFSRTHFVPGYDFDENDTHPNDDQGHGTHVAGTIAQSTNNGFGTAGVAYNASIMPVKVLNSRGSGSYADIASGIRWAADNGADVINLSLGGNVGTSYLEEAVRYAHEKGVVIVAAAGNSGQSTVAYPAAYDDYVIAVGATRYDETRAPYSNYGSRLDIVAPGGDTSLDQNGDGYIDGILQQTFYRRTNRFGYYFYQGTSMATPHVSGVAALLLSRHPSLAPGDVRGILEASAKDIGTAGRDNQYGWGLLDAYQALLVSDGGAVPQTPVENSPEPEPIDEPPVVTLTAPTNNQVVSGITTIAADASDDNGVSRVVFSIDGVDIATDTTAPYTAQWNTEETSNGNSVVTAVVHDDASQTASDAITVVVENSGPAPDPKPTPSSNNRLFEESFESSLWSAQNGHWSRSDSQSSDGSFSARYHGDRDDTFTSATIDISSYGSATVEFDWYLDRRIDRNEYLAFDISTDGGATWTEHARLRGNRDAERVWHQHAVAIEGASSLMMRFRGSASRDSEYGYVDNVRVSVQ